MASAGFVEVLEALRRADVELVVIRPTSSYLLGTGHNLFNTVAGDLDCRGTIDDGRLGYDELELDSIEITLHTGLTCRALELSRLIEVKQRAGRPKDLAVLPVLRATLDELRKR